MQSVGRFCLKNEGLFDVKLQFVYYDEHGGRHHVDGTGAYPGAQNECRKPGELSSRAALSELRQWGHGPAGVSSSGRSDPGVLRACSIPSSTSCKPNRNSSPVGTLVSSNATATVAG
jgi:hypothetical protein